MPRTQGQKKIANDAQKKTAKVAQKKTSTSITRKTTKERSGSKSPATAGNKRQRTSSSGATQEKRKRNRSLTTADIPDIVTAVVQSLPHPHSVLRLPKQLAVAGPEATPIPVNPLVAKAAATANRHQPASQETTMMTTPTMKSLVRVIAYSMRVIALLASMHIY